MDVQTDNADLADEPRPSGLPVVLSVMFPGAGQFFQGRWLSGLFHASVFLACFVIVLVLGLKTYFAGWRAAAAIGHGDNEIPVPSLNIFHIIIPAVIALVIYVVGLFDTWLACERERRAWARRRFERRARQIASSTLLSLALLLVPQSAVGGDIHKAVARNDVVAVDVMLAKNRNLVNEATEGGVTPLHLAAAGNQRVMTGVLAAFGANLNARTPAGFTPLYWAAVKNATDSAQVLLFLGADVNAQATNGLTALHWAAAKNATNMVTLLVTSGADPNLKTTDGYTPLEYAISRNASDAAFLLRLPLIPRAVVSGDIHKAVARNDVVAVDVMLAKNRSLANEATEGGVTPLHLAAAGNQKVMTGVLAAFGANLNARTPAGFTPLHWAAVKNATDSAQVLLFLGADVNAQATNGLTALHWAAAKNATNMVKLLVMSGADLNLTTTDGHTPLEYAVSRNASDAAFLLRLPHMPRAAVSGEIHKAIASNDVVAVETMLAKNSSLANQATGHGITPLHLAAAGNHKVMTGVLAAFGANLNARTPDGFTPLHWAAAKNATDSARALLFLGADVNAQATNGLTALHWAAGKNATNTVKLLVMSGANLSLTTTEGYTPLEYAVSRDASDAALLLAFHMASREIERELAQDRRAQPPAPNKPALADEATESGETAPPAVPQNVSRPVPGKAFIVPIGYDQEIEFVWVESLKLWVGKYEISNVQYRTFDRKHDSLFREQYSLNGDQQPVVYVSWHQARSFCQWLNKNFSGNIPAQYEFRLPTDQEWMTAARCGDKRVYPWGKDWPPRYGNFSDLTAKKNLSSWRGIDRYDDGHAVTCPVAESGGNEWGIYGLAGNVWEWCEDWYDSSQKYKVRHGGSWDFDTQPLLRIEARGFDKPDTRSDTVGFRVVIAGKRK